MIYILQSTSTYSISFISEKSVNSLSNHLNLEFKRIWKEKMITVNAYPALVIVLSDLHSLSTILQATQQGSQGSSQQSSKSSNKACSGALRPANSNRSCAFQESEAVTTPSPSTGPWKALGHQNPGTLRVPEPALCTYTATAGALGIPGGVLRSPGHHQEPHPQ